MTEWKLTTSRRKTSYRWGVFNLPYRRIVATIGPPNIRDDPGKVDASWGIEARDGRYVYLWNYKNGPNYTGEGTVDDISFWSGYGYRSLFVELFPSVITKTVDEEFGAGPDSERETLWKELDRCRHENETLELMADELREEVSRRCRECRRRKSAKREAEDESRDLAES